MMGENLPHGPRSTTDLSLFAGRFESTHHVPATGKTHVAMRGVRRHRPAKKCHELVERRASAAKGRPKENKKPPGALLRAAPYATAGDPVPSRPNNQRTARNVPTTSRSLPGTCFHRAPFAASTKPTPGERGECLFRLAYLLSRNQQPRPEH